MKLWFIVSIASLSLLGTMSFAQDRESNAAALEAACKARGFAGFDRIISVDAETGHAQVACKSRKTPVRSRRGAQGIARITGEGTPLTFATGSGATGSDITGPPGAGVPLERLEVERIGGVADIESPTRARVTLEPLPKLEPVEVTTERK